MPEISPAPTTPLTSLLDQLAGRVFPAGTSFENCTFNTVADFSGCHFLGAVNFNACTFTKNVRFVDVIFKGPATFTECRFQGHSFFTGAVFEQGGSFDRAKFALLASFREVEFKSYQEVISFRDATFTGGAGFEKAHFEERADFNSTTFTQEACFAGAKFGGTADFQNVRFLGSPAQFIALESTFRLTFQKAIFKTIPEFFGAKCFDVRFSSNVEKQFEACLKSPPTGWPSDFYDNAYHSFRALRALMAGNGSLEQEQMFFRLELHAREIRDAHEISQQDNTDKKNPWMRRFKLSGLKALDSGYRKLCNHGFSIWRPIAGWLLLLVSFIALCGLVSRLTASHPQWSGTMASKIISGSLTHLWPLSSNSQGEEFLKTVAHGDGPWLWLLEAILLPLKLFSAVFIFLVGLAIRNRFRIK